MFLWVRLMGVAEYIARKAIRSMRTAEIYGFALKAWGRSLGADPDVLVERIKKGELNPYDVLNNFIAYLTARKLSPNTIWSYYIGLKDFLVSEDVPLDPLKLKSKVTLPSSYDVSTDRAPTQEEVKRIMLHSTLRGKVIISMLTSSGMRIGELANLRIEDIEFGSPTKIRIKAKTSKSRRSRTVFISNEAAEYLEEFLGNRIERKDENVFINVREEKPQPVTTDALYDAVMDKIFKAGLKTKMDSESPRYALHPHCLRKYFFTNCLSSGIDRGIVEAWMGHKFGLDGAYLRLGEEELVKEYFKAMDRFTFLTGNSGQLKSRIEQLEQELADLRKQAEWQAENAHFFFEVLQEFAPEACSKLVETKGMSPEFMKILERIRRKEAEDQSQKP